MNTDTETRRCDTEKNSIQTSGKHRTRAMTNRTAATESQAAATITDTRQRSDRLARDERDDSKIQKSLTRYLGRGSARARGHTVGAIEKKRRLAPAAHVCR